MIDYQTARDQIFAQLESVKPNIASYLGYTPICVYQGIETTEKPDTSKLWFRLSMQTVLESQATLSGNDLKRRYTTDGLVFVQIFVPRTRPQDYNFGLAVADLILKAYRGKSTVDCVWFRNVRRQELPPETAWNRINVVAEYQYDEIG